jgi:hypothetical protein
MECHSPYRRKGDPAKGSERKVETRGDEIDLEATEI